MTPEPPHFMDGMEPMSAKQGWITAVVVVGAIGTFCNLGHIVSWAQKVGKKQSEPER